VILAMFRGNPIGVDLPASVVLEVTYAEPGVKGNTVSGATKAVTVETGMTVQVPLFIEQGERIKVDTRTGSYMTRE
jgi:elongation factor P